MSTNDGERQARIDAIRSDLARPWQEVERAVETARWLLSELEAAQAREQALVEAGAVLVEYVEHQLSLARLAAIEAWRAALAGGGPVVRAFCPKGG